MDLHDGVIQSLYAVSWASVRSNSVPATEANLGVEQAIDRINAVIKDLRTSIFGICDHGSPGARACRGHEPLAEDLCGNTPARPGIWTCTLTRTLCWRRTAFEIFAADHFREATSNAVRHAHATRVEI